MLNMGDENGLIVFVPEEAPAVLAGAASNGTDKMKSGAKKEYNDE
jgi:hypothetical protein